MDLVDLLPDLKAHFSNLADSFLYDIVEGLEIKVKYDTQRIGAFTKTVTIVTNEKTNNTHTLTIKGTVEMTTEKEGLPTKDSGVFNNGKN
ncbi:MAG: hypothetical protein RJA90_811 [Bacteroidota bacterium]